MSDLYDIAAALPRLLRGVHPSWDYRMLRDRGHTRGEVRWAANRRRLSRPYRGVYLDGTDPVDLLDTVRAALLVAPPESVVAEYTGAMLHGFGIIPIGSVHLVVPPGTVLPRRPGLVVHESVLSDDVVEIAGLPCLPAARCAVDLARRLPRHDALSVFDAALRSQACTVEELVAEVARQEGLRGIRQARELLPLASPLAECRQETHLRLVIVDGRLPVPVPQLVIVDEWGVERHRSDLGYEKQRVLLEYDGSSHLDRDRLRTDRKRHNWLSNQGWRMRYFTAADLYHRPDQILLTVRIALNNSTTRKIPTLTDLSRQKRDTPGVF